MREKERRWKDKGGGREGDRDGEKEARREERERRGRVKHNEKIMTNTYLNEQDRWNIHS